MGSAQAGSATSVSGSGWGRIQGPDSHRKRTCPWETAEKKWAQETVMEAWRRREGPGAWDAEADGERLVGGGKGKGVGAVLLPRVHELGEVLGEVSVEHSAGSDNGPVGRSPGQTGWQGRGEESKSWRDCPSGPGTRLRARRWGPSLPISPGPGCPVQTPPSQNQRWRGEPGRPHGSSAGGSSYPCAGLGALPPPRESRSGLAQQTFQLESRL